MNNGYQILSAQAFLWFVTIVTGIVAAGWAAWDGYRLLRMRPTMDLRDPIVRDEFVGYITGVVIGLIGIVGIIKYHLTH